MRRLYPPSGPDETIDASGLDALYGGRRPDGPGRPWVGVCMIASLDGSTALDGRSGGLGNDNDRLVFGALRRAADVIIVGAATVAAEGYRAPRKPGQRIGVVTASGRVDTDSELFGSGAGFLIVPDDGPHPPGVDLVRAGTGRVDLAAALEALPELVGDVRFVQSEGGAALNGALLDAGCIDELNVSIAPFLAGGSAPRVVDGAAETTVGLELVHVLGDDDGYLFTRWMRRA